MASDFQTTVGYLIHELSRLINREYDRRMSDLGLTRAQWWVLAKLYFYDGVTQSELAAELGFSKAAVGLLLDRLEGKGWIQRTPHEHDRRARCVHATAKAASLMESIHQVALEMNDDLVRGISEREQSRLTALLHKIRRNLLVESN